MTGPQRPKAKAAVCTARRLESVFSTRNVSYANMRHKETFPLYLHLTQINGSLRRSFSWDMHYRGLRHAVWSLSHDALFLSFPNYPPFLPRACCLLTGVPSAAWSGACFPSYFLAIFTETRKAAATTCTGAESGTPGRRGHVAAAGPETDLRERTWGDAPRGGARCWHCVARACLLCAHRTTLTQNVPGPGRALSLWGPPRLTLCTPVTPAGHALCGSTGCAGKGTRRAAALEKGDVHV